MVNAQVRWNAVVQLWAGELPANSPVSSASLHAPCNSRLSRLTYRHTLIIIHTLSKENIHDGFNFRFIIGFCT